MSRRRRSPAPRKRCSRRRQQRERAPGTAAAGACQSGARPKREGPRQSQRQRPLTSPTPSAGSRAVWRLPTPRRASTASGGLARSGKEPTARSGGARQAGTRVRREVRGHGTGRRASELARWSKQRWKPIHAPRTSVGAASPPPSRGEYSH